MIVYDQEHDRCSSFVWWRESAAELRSGWRWPRWEEDRDFGSFLSGVIRERMRKQYERSALRWRDFTGGLVVPWTPERLPWWHWRALWSRVRGRLTCG